MAKASRNLRKQRRQKRQLSIMAHAATHQHSELLKTQMMLLAVLAQKGGEVIVTTGTMQQVLKNYRGMGWTLVPGVEPNERIVRMTEDARVTFNPLRQDEEEEPAPADGPTSGVALSVGTISLPGDTNHDGVIDAEEQAELDRYASEGNPNHVD